MSTFSLNRVVEPILNTRTDTTRDQKHRTLKKHISTVLAIFLFINLKNARENRSRMCNNSSNSKGFVAWQFQPWTKPAVPSAVARPKWPHINKKISPELII
jgi:hypothetical protein